MHLTRLALLVGSLATFALAPASAQEQLSISIVVPDEYPAFDAAVRAEQPGARELRALVFLRNPPELANGASTGPVILLSPDHINGETLRAALVVVHNHRERGAPDDAGWFVALTADERLRPVPAWAAGAFAARVHEIVGARVEEHPQYGQARTISIENLGQFVRPERGGRPGAPE